MIDIKLVREETETVKDALRKRGEETTILDKLLQIEAEKGTC